MRVIALISLAALASAKVIPRDSTSNKIIPRDADIVERPRIVGGRPATSSEFGSTAYMEITHDGRTNLCTGSLIAPNVVLTASHCVVSDSDVPYLPSSFQVAITHAVPSSSAPFQGIAVSKVIAYPNFTMRNLKNDIALLILSESVPASTATPIKIFTGGYSRNTPIRAAGFGLMDSLDETSLPSQLMVVDLAIGSQSICDRNSDTYESKTQLCTDGTAGKDTCQGDSGGPLITPAGTGKPPALLALTSYGTTNSLNPLGLCGARGSSGYYTYIAPFLNWVAKSANLDVDAIRVGGSGSGDDDDSKPTNDDDDSKPTNDDDDSPTTRSTKSRSRTSRTTSPTSASRKPTDDDDDDDVPPPFWRASGASRSHFGLAAAGVAVAAMLF